MEKSAQPYELPAPVPQRQPRGSVLRSVSYVLFPLLVLFTILKQPVLDLLPSQHSHNDSSSSQCAQVDPLFPSENNGRLEDMYDYISTSEFKTDSIKRLSGAVQIATESYDDLGPVGEDPRWETRYAFHDYLKKTFPRVHEHMQLEFVHTYGLIYTWKGSDEDLKPVLLMAHQDVVPVPNATVDAWTHPPYSGYYDGKSVWGRGSSDCKNSLIAIMETMELFIDAGYEPKRTVVLSFGFDEEMGGRQGAGYLGPYLLKRYGKDGIAGIVDEGNGFMEAWGSVFAAPGTGEKGYTDVHITIRMPGGHSSIPYDHTSIGVLSELITKIEADQYPTYLTDENPYLKQLQCGAAHSSDFPKKIKKLLGRRESHSCRAKPDHLALEAAKESLGIKYLMQTSQAVDVIEGGVKVNALPERVSVTVNHRINNGDEPEMVWRRLTSLAKPIAKKYNLTLHAFDGTQEAAQSISLWDSPTTLRPAPITPTDIDRTTPYSILAGTTRAVYGEDIIVSPGSTTGNTDTRFYWPLTKHIFRFGPGYDPSVGPGLGKIHTVDEHISMVNHIGMVKWFTLFVRNMEEADLED
ncbi:uncharacterized protein LTR77_003860 [Saxophila tyrrhenica]|uniref:Peptidase M20 dimerisation domain-containing protein n=1 Tax=Saxophila tyrrhenica TaxID=1690608 RepID=A0AAV9PGE9_9PEZI|nr:hypothetical protein LTR77_003860 [Saxophila tyrrhenica]